MGIDLGTCNTLVAVRGEGILLNEPSVVAVRKGTNRVLNNGNAVGYQAKEMLGKTPGSISAIRPLKDGVISDFEITEAMLSYFIRKATGRARIISPRVVIAVPSGITAVEKRAVLDSAERAGARTLAGHRAQPSFSRLRASLPGAAAPLVGVCTRLRHGWAADRVYRIQRAQTPQRARLEPRVSRPAAARSARTRQGERS